MFSLFFMICLLFPFGSASPFGLNLGTFFLSTKSLDSLKIDFFQACRQGKKDQVEKILDHLQKGSDSVYFSLDDWRDSNGNTGLIMAAAMDQSKVVELLASVPRTRTSRTGRALRLDINRSNKSNYTALQIAVSKNNLKSVWTLLKFPELFVNSGILHWIIAKGPSHLKMLGVLLDRAKGLNVNQVDDNGMTALMFAASKNQVWAIELLLKYAKGLQVNQTDKHGNTALTIALARGYPKVASSLLQAPGIDIESPLDIGENTLNGLQMACMSGYVDLIPPMLKIIKTRKSKKDQISIVNVAHIFEGGSMTGLHFACANNHTLTVKSLIKHGADILDINKPGQNGMTALMMAAKRGYFQIVETLLNSDLINLDAVDEYGWTALHFAVDMGHVNIVSLLLLSGLDANARDQNGQTSLMKAARNGNPEIVQRLLDHEDTDLTVFDNNQMNALMYACTNNRYENVKVMLSSSHSKTLDVNAKNHHGLSALMMSLGNEYWSIVRLLTQNAPYLNVSLGDEYGVTPLMYAAKFGSNDIIPYLLSRDKNIIHGRDDRSWTPLIFAMAYNQKQTTSMLLDFMDENSSDFSVIFKDLLDALSWDNQLKLGMARMILVHKIWQRFSMTDDTLKNELAQILDADDAMCVICLESHKDVREKVITECRHIFGRKCLMFWLQVCTPLSNTFEYNNDIFREIGLVPCAVPCYCLLGYSLNLLPKP